MMKTRWCLTVTYALAAKTPEEALELAKAIVRDPAATILGMNLSETPAWEET